MSNKQDSEDGSILDVSVLEDLQLIMQDEFTDILQTFLDESVSFMSDVHSAFYEESDLLLSSLEALKSSSHNVGAKSLGEISGNMEALVKAGDVAEAKNNLAVLQEVFTETHRQVKKYRENKIRNVVE